MRDFPRKAYLSLGSNMGNSQELIQKAIQLLASSASQELKITKISPLYLTQPYGPIEQAPFYNLCLALELELSASELLKLCLDTEKLLGRTRKERWGPRLIDIDIIDYNLEEHSAEQLTLPHPLFLQRLFVLAPLADIAGPELLSHYPIISKLEALRQENQLWVKKIEG